MHCNKCRVDRPIEEFARVKVGSEKRRAICKSCNNKRRRKGLISRSGRKPGRWTKEVEDDEFEFAKAIQQYKQDHKIKFLMNSEILAVLKSLGYKKC